MAWRNDQIRDLVIRTIIGEAARNDRDSMISVANVLKNRAISGNYGDPTVNGLTNTIRAPKQFSMWNSDIVSSGKTISPNDPYYQRAGAIADAVFSGEIPDNTGGADHYYAPSGMSGGHAPSWAIGQTPTATIGGQHFYKLGLSASDATNYGHTSAPAIGTPAPPSAPLATLGNDKPEARQAINSALSNARSMLGKNEVPNHDEIMQYLHDGGQDLDPHKLAWCAAFVSASLQKAGLPVPTQVVKDSAFGGGALAGSYKTYGSAVDPNGIQAGDILVANDGSHVGFAEGPVRQGPNGPEVQMIAGNEKDASGQYAPGSYTNPTTGAVANRAQVGMVSERWVPVSEYTARRYDSAAAAPAPTSAPLGQGGIGSDARMPLGTAPAGTPAAVSTIVPNPANVPAADAQTVSASAPASGAYPGSDKYSVIQGMTTGTSHNPQLTTAANWGNLFGGASPVIPPAAAPAAPLPVPRPASAPEPAPTSTPAPTPVRNAWNDRPSGVPNASVSIPISSGGGRIRIDDNTALAPAKELSNSPLASIAPSWGSTTGDYDPDQHPGWAPNPNLPGTLGARATTAGQPTLGFPAMTNPFGTPPTQTSSLPGSMLASAQNLMKLLFPSATG